ncbi:MAG: 50S ribosomal protein L10 [bacterium JZ-2024 1]
MGVPPTRQRKAALLEELQRKIGTARAVYLLDFARLNTKRESRIRRMMKQVNAEYMVAKNTLLKLALSRHNIPIPQNGVFSGPTALVISYEDPLKPLKTIQQVIKEGDGIPVLKSAFLEGNYFTRAELKPLEKYQSRSEVIAETIGALQGVLVSIVSVLSAIPAEAVGTLEAIAEKRTAGGAS